MCVDRPLERLSKRQGNLHLFEKGGRRQRQKGNRNPIRDSFCFGGKYVALWALKGVSVAIRLFKASQWERGGARLSLLPCPPTGTDGHPRSSLISLQSGNDPCSWDVAALFKYDARCSPTFSMSSHCPRKPGGEREKDRETAQHPTTQHGLWDVVHFVLCSFSFPLLLFCCLSVGALLLVRVHPAEREISQETWGDLNFEKWYNLGVETFPKHATVFFFSILWWFECHLCMYTNTYITRACGCACVTVLLSVFCLSDDV